MSLLRRTYRRAEERSADSLARLLEQLRYGGVDNVAIDVVTDEGAVRHVTLYACVDLIATSIAGLSFRSYREDATGTLTPVPRQPIVLRRPWPGLTRFEWIQQVVVSLLIRGNAFLIPGDFDDLGYPRVLMPVHPDDVILKIEGRGPRRRLVYRLTGDPQPVEMIHLRLFVTAGSLVGASPLDLHRETITTGLHAERFGRRWFSDSAMPSSVLESDQEVGDDEAKENVARWMASHGGHRFPAFLSGGLKWRPITLMPNESQFLETQRWSAEQVCRVYHVPPYRVGLTNTGTQWGTGLEQQDIAFARSGLNPLIERLEQMHEEYTTPRGQVVRADTSTLTRGDTKSRYATYLQGRQGSFLTVNEIRAKEGLPPVEGGDDPWRPLASAKKEGGADNEPGPEGEGEGGEGGLE